MTTKRTLGKKPALCSAFRPGQPCQTETPWTGHKPRVQPETRPLAWGASVAWPLMSTLCVCYPTETLFFFLETECTHWPKHHFQYFSTRTAPKGNQIQQLAPLLTFPLSLYQFTSYVYVHIYVSIYALHIYSLYKIYIYFWFLTALVFTIWGPVVLTCRTTVSASLTVPSAWWNTQAYIHAEPYRGGTNASSKLRKLYWKRKSIQTQRNSFTELLLHLGGYISMQNTELEGKLKQHLENARNSTMTHFLTYFVVRTLRIISPEHTIYLPALTLLIR